MESMIDDLEPVTCSACGREFLTDDPESKICYRCIGSAKYIKNNEMVMPDG